MCRDYKRSTGPVGNGVAGESATFAPSPRPIASGPSRILRSRRNSRAGRRLEAHETLRSDTVHRRFDHGRRGPRASADQSLSRRAGLRLAGALRGAPGDRPGGGRACIHGHRPASPGTLRALGRMPGAVLMHGAGGSQCGLWWAARHLAGHGYVTLVLTHAGQLAGHEQAVRAGVRWLRSRSNPLRRFTLRNRIGLVGHSQGSNASMLSQDEPGVRALAALDSLKRFAQGDRAAAIGCRRPHRRVTPIVPALGFAMDRPCASRPALIVPDLKKTGHALWKSAGRPTMTLVMRGFEHSSFTSRGTEEQLAASDIFCSRGSTATYGGSGRRQRGSWRLEWPGDRRGGFEHDVPLGGLLAHEARLRGLRELSACAPLTD